MLGTLTLFTVLSLALGQQDPMGDDPLDELYRGFRPNVAWRVAISPEDESARVLWLATELPDTCGASNGSASVVVSIFRGANAASLDSLARKIISTARHRGSEVGVLQDTTVGRWQTVLSVSLECSPPCLMIDRVGQVDTLVVHLMAVYPLLAADRTLCAQPLLADLKELCGNLRCEGVPKPVPALVPRGNRLSLELEH